MRNYVEQVVFSLKKGGVQFTQDKNKNESVMSQKETNCSIYLYVAKTQGCCLTFAQRSWRHAGYLCDIKVVQIRATWCTSHPRHKKTKNLFPEKNSYISRKRTF